MFAQYKGYTGVSSSFCIDVDVFVGDGSVIVVTGVFDIVGVVTGVAVVAAAGAAAGVPTSVATARVPTSGAIAGVAVGVVSAVGVVDFMVARAGNIVTDARVAALIALIIVLGITAGIASDTRLVVVAVGRFLVSM